jgi:glutamate carboxypeptidase
MFSALGNKEKKGDHLTRSRAAGMRFSQNAELERVQRQADKTVQNHLVPGTEVTVEFENRRPPLPRNRASEEMAEKAKLICREIGLWVEPAKMRFGTDAGFAYDPLRNKSAVLETMGIVGKRIHSPDEFAEINSIMPRLYLTVRMIQALSGVEGD